MANGMGLSTGRSLAVLAALAALAYAPLLTIPLIEDDYPNLWMALDLGRPAGAVALLRNPVFQMRATSFWAMYALWGIARLAPWIYHLVSLLLHVANTWLVYAICLAWPRMRPAALWAAAFFAIQEGHQEAVMWFSAINELLQFLFGMGALWCWLTRERGWGRQLAGLLLFGLALLSKESAVIVLPLMVLATPPNEWRRAVWRIAPYVALTGLAVALVLASRGTSFRFSDGSFSWQAPFWTTWPRNYGRVVWIWGLPAAAGVLLARDGRLWRASGTALAWIGIALLPYCFLTYSAQIPSRQTYLASAGLAMLVGLAMAWWQPRWDRRMVTAVLLVVLLHNVGYLWIRKRSQFLERAAPTEQLIALARSTPGPIWVRCFPRNSFIAEGAVHLAAGYTANQLVWNEADAVQRKTTATFCYSRR